MRFRTTIGNGVGGTRQQVLTTTAEGAPVVYPAVWLVSHDGEIFNPVGRGLLRHFRIPVGFGSPTGDNNLTSIKNSGRMTLSPALDEI
jgi:hypothetical protein